MSTVAFTLMISVQAVVTIITIYFFMKVLRAPSKPEPDSYSDNDPQK